MADIEKRIEEAVRSWVDDLGQALVEQLGEDRGLALADKYQGNPPGYRPTSCLEWRWPTSAGSRA